MSSSTSPPWLASLLGRKPTTLYAWSPSNLEGLPDTSARITDKDDDSERRVYVLGIGNIGRLIATSLAQLPARPPITLVVHREELLRHWAAQPGIELTRDGEAKLFPDFEIELWSDSPPVVGSQREVSDIRHLIVTTKSTAALAEVDRASRYLGSNSTVVFAQNGMNKLWPPTGPAYVESRFGARGPTQHPNYLACVVGHGVFSQGPFKSTHAAPLDINLGRVLLNPTSSHRADYLSGLLLTAPYLEGREAPRPEFWAAQLEKLVINCAVNPLTAILRCRNDGIFVDAPLVVTRVVDRVVAETSSVLQALIRHESTSQILDSEPSGLTRTTLLEQFSEARLRSMVDRYGMKIVANYSSMYQDAKAGKKTEIGDMNGWVVETAAWLGGDLDVTTNKTLVGLIEKGAVVDVASLGEYFLGVDAP